MIKDTTTHYRENYAMDKFICGVSVFGKVHEGSSRTFVAEIRFIKNVNCKRCLNIIKKGGKKK